MSNVPERDPNPQARHEENARDQAALLNHALSRAAAVIAGLLCDDPTAADARVAARAWLLTWHAQQIADRFHTTAGRLAALAAGGAS